MEGDGEEAAAEAEAEGEGEEAEAAAEGAAAAEVEAAAEATTGASTSTPSFAISTMLSGKGSRMIRSSSGGESKDGRRRGGEGRSAMLVRCEEHEVAVPRRNLPRPSPPCGL